MNKKTLIKSFCIALVIISTLAFSAQAKPTSYNRGEFYATNNATGSRVYGSITDYSMGYVWIEVQYKGYNGELPNVGGTTVDGKGSTSFSQNGNIYAKTYNYSDSGFYCYLDSN